MGQRHPAAHFAVIVAVAFHRCVSAFMELPSKKLQITCKTGGPRFEFGPLAI
jgi:hypothetical protein